MQAPHVVIAWTGRHQRRRWRFRLGLDAWLGLATFLLAAAGAACAVIWSVATVAAWQP